MELEMEGKEEEEEGGWSARAVVVCGVSAVGKSTVGAELARVSGAAFLDGPFRTLHSLLLLATCISLMMLSVPG